MSVDGWFSDMGTRSMKEAVSNWLKTVFAEAPAPTTQALAGFPDNTLAACALLIEVTLADHEEDPTELAQIQKAMETQFGVSNDVFDTLLAAARLHVKQSVSFYEHTRVLNDGMTHKEKIELIGLMWSVAYADQHLDHYEEHLIRRVADLLYVDHSDFILAKLEAKARAGRA